MVASRNENELSFLETGILILILTDVVEIESYNILCELTFRIAFHIEFYEFAQPQHILYYRCHYRRLNIIKLVIRKE